MLTFGNGKVLDHLLNFCSHARKAGTALSWLSIIWTVVFSLPFFAYSGQYFATGA